VHRAPGAPTRVRMEASRGARAEGRHGGLDSKTFSWKLQAASLPPAQSLRSFIDTGTLRPSGASADALVGCMRRLGGELDPYLPWFRHAELACTTLA
jgi:hypothetical protein